MFVENIFVFSFVARNWLPNLQKALLLHANFFKTNAIWVLKSADFDADFGSVGKFGIKFFRKNFFTVTE
jgi:hypothetical protein